MDNTDLKLRDETLTRKDLARRWHCSVETIKRRERDGSLQALRLSARIVRYRMVDIVSYEKEAMSHVAQR